MAQPGPKNKPKQAAPTPTPGVWPGQAVVVYLGPSIPSRDGGPLVNNTIFKLDAQGRIAFGPARDLMRKYPDIAKLAAPITEAPRIRQGLRESGSPQAQAVEALNKALAEARKARSGKGDKK